MTFAPKHPIFLPLMSNAMLMQIMQPTHTGVWGALRSRRCMPWWRASLTSSHGSSTVNLHEEMLTSIPSSLGSMWWSPQTMQSCLSTQSRSARMGGCSLGRRFNHIRDSGGLCNWYPSRRWESSVTHTPADVGRQRRFRYHSYSSRRRLEVGTPFCI